MLSNNAVMYLEAIILKDDRETKQKLLASAKTEFMEKGYMQASLRNICKNAGVTTGALYFFFQDKEDLFASLVDAPLEKLYELMAKHYTDEIENLDMEEIKKMDFSEDINASKQIVHYIYECYDAFQLVLTKGQGSRFEQTIDKFVEITEKHYRVLADQMSGQMGCEKVDDYMIHWFSHMQIDAFVHLITHEPSEKAALKHIESMVRYMISGWLSMFCQP